MFSHCGRSYKSGSTWEKGTSLLKGEIFLWDFQDDLLDQFYALQQGNLRVIDYARKFKELFPDCRIVEDGHLTIAGFKSGLRS